MPFTVKKTKKEKKAFKHQKKNFELFLYTLWKFEGEYFKFVENETI